MKKNDKFLREIKTKKDLIKFYKKIPENKWTTGDFIKRKKNEYSYCAIGHLGVTNTNYRQNITNTIDRLISILKISKDVQQTIVKINDGRHPEFKQESPKKRILAYLESK